MAEDAPRDRSERVEVLRSAWSALEAVGISAEASRMALADVDAPLDLLEREVRDLASGLPIDRLRATLAQCVVLERRSVLDLLDLVLGAEPDRLEEIDVRIPTLDVLITLLCTVGNPSGRLHDPVLLTERLQRMCEQSVVEYDPRLPELEAEFYAAANLRDGEPSNGTEHRTLRLRKTELGPSFFAPGVLRAIVTYNAALMRRSGDPAPIPRGAENVRQAQAPTASGGSLFERPAISKLAAALRRRAAGQQPDFDAIDRIAWCLDLNDLRPAEREALLSESTGRADGLEGTTVLLGLLCRSAVVLEDEFPAVGIATDELTGEWSRELADLLQQEVNRHIAGNYGRASMLTELKSRFLKVTKSKQRTPRAAQPQMLDEAPDERWAQNAKTSKAKKAPEPAMAKWREFPWGAAARKGAVGLFAVMALFALLDTLVWNQGRVGGAELGTISPFLSSGKRSDGGTGPAFRGTLDEAWFALEPAKQQDAAVAMVSALRGRGARDVMVYDDEGHLRIQALGAQPARVVR